MVLPGVRLRAFFLTKRLTWKPQTPTLRAMSFLPQRLTSPYLRAGVFTVIALACTAAFSAPLDAPPAADPASYPFISDTEFPINLVRIRDAVSNTTSELILNAMGFLGVPYKRGGSSETSGFDCSGFVRTTYERTLGLVLPRRAAEQAEATTPIKKEELRPGDLVFFNTMRRTFSHVGIYLGEGKFIHAPRAGAKVRVEDMRQAYWTQRFNGARRVEASQSDKK